MMCQSSNNKTFNIDFEKYVNLSIKYVLKIKIYKWQVTNKSKLIVISLIPYSSKIIYITFFEQ